jgi:outer membrane protein TolC
MSDRYSILRRNGLAGFVSCLAEAESLIRPHAFTVCMALVCLLLSGCAARMNRSVEGYVGSAISRETAPAAGQASGDTRLAGPAVFTFSQACERAADNDRDVARAIADASRSQVDVAQAHSRLWPRIDVRSFFQHPIGGNTVGVPAFSGGVYFRYELQQAIFSGDATALARAKVAQGRENVQMAIDRLSRDLFLQLADREALRAEAAQRRQILKQNSDAQERAHQLGHIGRLKTEQIIEFQIQYENSSRLYENTLRKLAEINRTICNQVLTDCAQDVVITDLPELIAQMDALVPESSPGTQFVQGVWSKRHDTKVAEIDLFMKEMAVVDERRKRLPTISPSIGFGSMSLSSSLSQSPVVIQLGASMPLIDFGDIKRSISKASIDRDLARQNISLLLLKVHRELLDKSASLSDAIAARGAVESQRNSIAKRSGSDQKLIEAGVLDPLDLLNLRVRAAESEIDAARARSDVSKAAAEYTYACGRSLDGGAPAQPGEAVKK